MRPLVLLAGWIAAIAAPALARDVHGVKVDERATFQGHELRLNGAGLRSKFIFAVYVGALYLETPARDPRQVVARDDAWRLSMRFVRDVGRDRVIAAYRYLFERQTEAAQALLRAGVERFEREVLSRLALREGDELALSYAPGQGVTLTAPGLSSWVPGKAFADALLLAWFAEPEKDALKLALLGRDRPRPLVAGGRDPAPSGQRSWTSLPGRRRYE